MQKERFLILFALLTKKYYNSIELIFIFYMEKIYKILLAEDDETISWIYKSKLESEKYNVVVAVNGAEALTLAKSENPDLMLLDVIMPQLDGFSVLDELKKDPATNKIPVVMLTNLGTEEDKIKGEKLGAVDYLVKASLTPSQIIEKIKKYLNN